MRSRRSRGIFVTPLVLLVPSCDGRDHRVTDICVTLHECTSYLNVEDCRDTITDALADRRITDGEMARCSECLGEHATSFDPSGRDREDCYDLLVERDCENACAAVPVALRARTNSAMRREVCAGIKAACGQDAAPTCRNDLEREFDGLPLDAQLELDDRVLGCRQCIVAPSSQVSVRMTDVAACNTLVQACTETCRQVESVHGVLETAADAVTVCRNDESCFRASSPSTPRPRGGAGGAAGAGGDGGESGSAGEGGAGPTPTGTCMEHLFEWVQGPPTSSGAPRELLADCALCVDALPCESIAMNCAERCAELESVR
jgi:hypothetical protein